MGTVGVLFAPEIVSLFSDEAEVIAVGADRLKLVLPFYVFCSLMDVAGSQIRGMGRSVQPMIISLLGACGLRIFWGQHGSQAIFLCIIVGFATDTATFFKM